jgi:hypothetical protein
MTKRLPAGVITTRADGSQWQAPADPGAEWKQVRDGDNTPQTHARPSRIEGVGGGGAAGAGGYALMRSKFDLDGFMPPDELHPDHVSVDTEGDMDGKPVLSWAHEGKERRSYTMNFHQRKHRHTFSAMQQHKVALSRAPQKLLELYRAAPDGDKDRYLAAHVIAAHGHTPDQVLAVQRGHAARTLRKAGKPKLNVLLQHAGGRMFQWETSTPELSDHYMSQADRSPTSPMFLCGPDCINTALDEVGLGGVPLPVIRAHAQSRMAVDLLSKAKRVRIDSLGAGLDKVRGAIAEASQKIAEYYGHAQAPADMSFVPPHVQAAFLEACGGAGVFKNTYDTLNVRKSVVTQEEDALWRDATEQVMKSIPSSISPEEVPTLVRALYERMLTEAPPQTSTPLKQSSTPRSEEKTTETPPVATLSSTLTTPVTSESSSIQPTMPTTPGTGSSPQTLSSASPAPLPTSSSTTTTSAPTDSPTEGLTSTPEASTTSGPSLVEKSFSPTATSTPSQETSTLSSQPSAPTPAFDLAPYAQVMAALVMKGAEGVLAKSGITFFSDLYSAITDEQTGLAFLTEVAGFIAVTREDARLAKAGSVAGTRGDPIGRISVHKDGSRWRKTGPGAWERVGNEGDSKRGKVGGGKKESVRVQVLRQRLKSLRARWRAAQSSAQRAQVVKELTAVKKMIKQITTGKVRKSHLTAEDDDVLGGLLIKAETLHADWRTELTSEMIAKGEGFVPPPAVRAAARRGLKLRREHGRGGLDTRQAKKQGVGSGVQRASDIASGDALSYSTVKRMKAFFSRHAQYGEHRQDKTSAAYISWLLWGGNAGRSWANKIVAQEEKRRGGRVSKSEVVNVVDKIAPLRDRCTDTYMREYLVEEDAYDIRKSLTPRDYVMRMLSDGAGAASEVRVMLAAAGYDAVVGRVATILKEVRDGAA